jgi:thiopeptide-type bacteriocin biosynthesis protein
LQEINNALKSFIDNELIYRIVLDTYIRELERYGDNTIEIAEGLFQINSMIVSKLTDRFNKEKIEGNRILLAICDITALFDGLNLEIKERLTIIQNSINSYSNDADLIHKTRDVIKREFRTYRESIAMIHGVKIKNEIEYAYTIQVFTETINTFREELYAKIKAYGEKSDKNRITDQLSSIIHMNINRTFTGNQRYYETIVYHLLAKYYQSDIAKALQISNV